jgi:hypothetical protein
MSKEKGFGKKKKNLHIGKKGGLHKWQHKQETEHFKHETEISLSLEEVSVNQ